MIALSLNGEVRAANRRFTELVGLSFQQIIGKKLNEFLDETGGQSAADLAEAMPRFLERRNWSGVVQVRLKSRNAVFYFDCVAHAMVRDDAVHGITVLARDVTALRRNEARFTELFESLQEGIYIVTPEDRIVDANPALVRILGYESKDELLARKVTDVFTDEALRDIVQAEVDRQPVVEGREITLIRKNGEPIICLNTAAAVRDNTGKVVRYQGALMDITGRREIERRLHKQQEFARRLVDSFPDLILVIDTDGKYTFVSPRCREVLGYEIEDTHEMQFGGRTHPDDLPALLALYSDILKGKQNFSSLEVRVRHKLGEWRRILFNFSPLFDENEKIEGVVLSGRDITELKRLGEQLIQSEKLAAIGQMLAGVAHELNNPLTAILGVTELVREREGLDESMKRQLDLTHRARVFASVADSEKAGGHQHRAGAHAAIARTFAAAERGGSQLPAGGKLAGRGRRREPVDSSVSEFAHQRGAGNSRNSRVGPDSDSRDQPRRQGDGHDPGRRDRHFAGRVGKNIRSFLYDQAAGWRHRAWAEYLHGDFARTWRND